MTRDTQLQILKTSHSESDQETYNLGDQSEGNEVINSMGFWENELLFFGLKVLTTI